MTKTQAGTRGNRSPLDIGVIAILCLLIFCWVAFVFFGTFTPLTQPISGVDPVGYYSWVRSLVFDFDLQFENEYRALNTQGAISGDILVDPDGPRTATDHLTNAFSIGPGLLWLPFVLIGHAVALASDYEANGFSAPYFASVAYANMLYGWAGVLLMYYALRKWFAPGVSAIAAVAAWLCSPALYYTYPVEAVSHACSLFAVSLLLFLWSRFRERDDLWCWFVIGAAVGLATLVRWQNITVAAVVAVDLLWRNQFKNVPKMAVSGIASILVFLPQLIAWKILFGSFFTIPQGGAFMDWTNPNPIKLFFSLEHGLITWTPLCAAGMVGLFLVPKEHRQVFAALLIALIAQLYVGSVAGNVGWSFGMRRMVNCVPLFAVGFALLMVRYRPKPAMALGVLAVFGIWNFLFVLQYGGILDPYYFDRALERLALEYRVPVTELSRRISETGTLPNGQRFDPAAFAEAHRFPRSGAPTFQQFVPDKLYVLRAMLYRILLIGA